MVEMFLLLVGLHYLADYGLQSSYIAEHKNFRLGHSDWKHVMIAHCAIHALFVGLATGIVWLAVAEFFVHFLADMAKSDHITDLDQDQIIHIFSKLLWVLLA